MLCSWTYLQALLIVIVTIVTIVTIVELHVITCRLLIAVPRTHPSAAALASLARHHDSVQAFEHHLRRHLRGVWGVRVRVIGASVRDRH